MATFMSIVIEHKCLKSFDAPLKYKLLWNIKLLCE